MDERQPGQEELRGGLGDGPKGGPDGLNEGSLLRGPDGEEPEQLGAEVHEHEQLPGHVDVRESGEQPTRPLLRIYAASLSDYNAGILHGRWIEASDDPEQMQSEIDEMLRASPTARTEGLPAEEWAIHDYDGFGHIHLEEYSGLDPIARLAGGVDIHGPAFLAWAELVGTDQAELEAFEDAYLGEWDSLEHYADEMLSDCGLDEQLDRAVPAALRPYVQVDVEGFARDLEYGGDVQTITTPEGRVWVFRTT